MGFFKVLKDVLSIFGFLKSYIKLMWYVLVITFVFSLLAMAEPLIYKFIIDDFLIGRSKEIFVIALCFYFVKTILFNIFYISREYLIFYISIFFSINMKRKMFRKFINSKATKENEVDAGTVITTFNDDVAGLEVLVSDQIHKVILTIFKFICVAAIIIMISWQFLLAIFLISVLRMANTSFWSKKMIPKYNEMWSSVSGVVDFVSQAFNYSRNLKIMSKEKYAEGRFFSKSREFMMSFINLRKVVWKIVATEEILGNLDKVVIYGVGGYLVYTGKISFGAFIALTMYEVMFRESLQEILYFNMNIYQAEVWRQRIERILTLSAEEKSGAKSGALKGDIEFINVNFKYDVEEKKVLENFNLKISSGEKLAIVGETGSGKSTIIKLLLGVYRPDSGEIRIDGKILGKEINIGDYRKKLGIVSQEMFFFKDTIRENLTIGKKTNDKRIMEKLKAAEAEEIIKSGEHGLDTVIEPGGSNLSGGQKQRLVIARMLIKNPDIVILDEATSALDNITEVKVQNSLEKELERKTVITIAHRLTTIINSDRIIVLEKGKIVESGNHEELIAEEGYYYSLINRHKKSVPEEAIIEKTISL